LRIVIAEDDVLLLDDVAGILRRGGHHVVATCASAVEMQAAMLEHRPDVVVFDVHLADGDGIHVFHACDRDGA
jgi:DNA-binding NtrC family response regulator